LVPVLSDVTAAEVQDAPATVRELHQELLVFAGRVLPVTAEALALVAAYVGRRILPAKLRADKALSILSPREVTTYEGD